MERMIMIPLLTMRQGRSRGQVLVIVAVCLVVLGLAATLSIDVGYWFTTKAELQNAADASGRSAMFTLLQRRVRGDSESDARQAAANEARSMAEINHEPARYELDFGAYDRQSDTFTSLDKTTPATVVRIRVIRDDEDGATPLRSFFGSLAGLQSMQIDSDAICEGGTHVKGMGPDSGLRPFGVPEESLESWSVGETVEVPIPGEDSEQLEPGNWGWLNISGGSEGTSVLREEIEDGYNEELILDETGDDGRPHTIIGGSPGMRAALYPSLEKLIDQDIVCFVYDDTSGEGSNMTFRIVGFVALRIRDVHRNSNEDPYLEAELLEMSHHSSAILGDGGSSLSNVTRIQLVQ